MNIESYLINKVLENKHLFIKENITCSGEDDLYLLRWKIFNHPQFSNIYIHNFKKPDVPIFHDHPWDFVSVVLSGSYTEYRPGEEPLVRNPGDIMIRSAEAAHYVYDLHGDVWTLVIRGPRRREWGFWTESGWIQHQNYLSDKNNSRAARVD